MKIPFAANICRQRNLVAVCGIACLLFLTEGLWATQAHSHRPKRDCVDTSGEFHIETQTQSEPVVSKSGIKVTTEVTATAVPRAKKDESCHVEWILRVTPPKERTRRIVVSSGEDAGDETNDFSVLGWSRDEDKILTVMASEQGDSKGYVPVVYSIRQQKSWIINLDEIFNKIAGKECKFSFEPSGFTSDGKIFVSLSADADLPEGAQPCLRLGGWLVNSDGTGAEPAPSSLHGVVTAVKEDEIMVRPDRRDGSVVAPVAVLINSATDHMFDRDGYFEFKDLRAGEYVWVWYDSTENAKPNTAAAVMEWHGKTGQKPPVAVRWRYDSATPAQ